jgi:hypothetical protein
MHLLMYNRQHHVQHLSSGGGAVVLQVPSGDGFEKENYINNKICTTTDKTSTTVTE